MERLPAERRITTLTFIGGFLAAAILVAAGLIIPSNPPDVWPDGVTAGLQVGVVTLLGAGITLALAHAQSIRDDLRQDEERAREDRRLKAEYRLGVFRDLVAAYNGVKSVRRTLRALGLCQQKEPQVMSAEHAVGFHEQMRSLVASQLSLERIVRELSARPSWFYDANYLTCEVRQAEDYVNRIVGEWEKHGSEIIAGASTSRVQSLGLLQAFLGPAAGDLTPNLSMRLIAVERNIRADLYGDEGGVIRERKSRPLADTPDNRDDDPRAAAAKRRYDVLLEALIGGSRSIPRRWKKAPNDPASIATAEIAYA